MREIQLTKGAVALVDDEDFVLNFPETSLVRVRRLEAKIAGDVMRLLGRAA